MDAEKSDLLRKRQVSCIPSNVRLAPLTMEIYLMRHGEPLTPADWGQGDATRPLSPAGQKKLDDALPLMARANFRPGSVLSSPFARALQTAMTVAKAGGEDLKARPLPELAAGVAAEGFRKALLKAKAAPPILVVGHMPDLAVFGARVIGDPHLIENGIRPGEIVALETGPLAENWGQGKILWRKTLEDWKN